MNHEIDRVKRDVEAIHKAMGFSPGWSRDWLDWMRRDHWMSLLWCLPGGILIVSALLPIDNTARYWRLEPGQWIGLAVAAAMLGVTGYYMRMVSGRNGRPDALIREYRRINGLTAQGAWLNFALGIGFISFFVWARQYQLAFTAFWSGLFIFMGSACLVAALAAKAWLLLGWAVPFLAYGLLETMLPTSLQGGRMALGMMFVAVALSFYAIQAWQLRNVESEHVAH